MTEPTAPAPLDGASAGAILRAARERQGLHIAVLAAAIKISPRKLDALEGDRFDELPDATFTRALAQTVCRALKIDAAPVMALLPAASPKSLDAVSDGLNTPFKDKSPSGDLAGMLPRAPLIWAALALLAAAALVMYWPSRPPEARRTAEVAAEPAVMPPPAAAEPARTEAAATPGPLAASASRPTSVLASPATLDFATASAPPGAAPAASSALGGLPDSAARPPSLPPTPMPTGIGAAISVSEPVWLEVLDASDKVLFQRTVQPGETVNFDQKPPLKLKIGNAAAARLSFRGEPVDLTPSTRSNVARLELK